MNPSSLLKGMAQRPTPALDPDPLLPGAVHGHPRCLDRERRPAVDSLRPRLQRDEVLRGGLAARRAEMRHGAILVLSIPDGVREHLSARPVTATAPSPHVARTPS